MGFACNISKKDRWTRVVFGSFILIAALLSLDAIFIIVFAGIMIIEGFIGWCGIADLIDRLEKK